VMTRKNNHLGLIFGFVFLDLLGYSLFLPLLPYYAETLGATPVLTGILVASNALAQFFASPIVGRLSDRLGRRPLLIFSIVGTLVSFLILGLAAPLGSLLAGATGLTLGTATLAMLFASRVLDGLAGGNISLARAYITDVTDEQNRAKGLGMIGAAFGLGFIIGPAIGGTLSNWGAAEALFASVGLSRYAVPAFVAVVLAALNLIGVVLLLPESLTDAQRAAAAQNPRRAFTARALVEALRRPRFGPLLNIRFFYNLAFTLFTANFSLYTLYRLQLTDQSTSYVLTYVGMLSVLVQGFAIGWLTRRFEERRLIFAASALMGVALLAWAIVPNVPLLLVVLAPLSLAGSVLNTITNSAVTKSIYPEEIGGAMGLSAALDSLTRVIAPLAGGLLLGRLGAWSLGVAGALMMVWVTAYAWQKLIVSPDPPLPGRVAGEAES
ncbi:MAG: MFS transporter, partial [Anaerolineae bacterium]|nr:MFS transporter [Anaerolineae bacterium]